MRINCAKSCEKKILKKIKKNGYKVYSFGLNTHAYHGLTLQAVCRDQNNQYCISAPLLWWHFQQAVLANMRGAGAPIFEDDFPPGTDQMGEILQGPMARQRMEFEMANRLHGVNNIGGQSRENRRGSLFSSPS